MYKKKTYYIDGKDFSTLDEFFNRFMKAIIPDAVEGEIDNLDALNDFLYRGDEKPENGFILVWKNSAISKENLGYAETIRTLENYLKFCHPLSRPVIQHRIELAKENKGPTMFDEILEVFSNHGDVELVLN